ncbi:Beta-glucuronosyltransferase GlcAT14B-like [Heracleum sosnowskyi]|uniref:Beta-glucuronosyltransferase GlcAT14B-like n=1 Tax=Heracleum sosnowskyi TaxID=360622 RepID=A0AAD8IYV3_9APIA|nr:Beta-glucuronosyltransferase GlcAT14B-like [Heracleum sosnowskyi]
MTGELISVRNLLVDYPSFDYKMSQQHPNSYIIHLDAESSPEERLDLLNFVNNCSMFVQFGNVRMITKADLVTYRGPTYVAHILHAAAVLLRNAAHWDWFINVSASDYPLVTQDGL